ncbi:MAG TPA: lipopolysaccharide kinase InaA family protein [Rhodocyclaceae bacterium]|nr:lipopolysaccharide kinase InaA family protein [Rhodocyclaceae bacterium]
MSTFQSFRLRLGLLRDFIAANLSSLRAGHLRLRGGHRPPAGHVVARDFTGVGVATAADPATDRYVTERLRELGVNAVRLDFTYGDTDGPAGRFLDALLADGFHVMLHLVQPFDAARNMRRDAARQQWQRFVATTLDRFGARVELIELGSTINRRRWAGYSLAGFLAAWQIAHREVRQRGLVLAGPGITDFEPLWNIGMLAILRKHDALPDIHTDNLFSERCTEPERFDHKILGHRLAPRIRYNLVKKARVLARIGADAGVPRLMSPAAFWTLPRIARLLPDTEQKQADYLARYMTLCAASGALERAAWGPLICHREGLIDEGQHPYPRIERITHYADLRGTPDDYRIRPAFHALAAFARLIPGSRYEGRLNDGEGLETHAFRSDTHLLHAVWTTNGRAAVLADLYRPDDLAAAESLDRDGIAQTGTPTLATESPLYLRWPAARPVQIVPGAAALRGLSIHRHARGTHQFHRDGDWQGMVLAHDRAEADTLLAALHPGHIGAATADDTLRRARNIVWHIDDPRRAGARLVVKQPRKHHLHKKLLDRFKPSKARRSWNGAAELLRRGIGTATPVAWFEQRSGKDLTKNWYVCEHVPGGLSVRKLFSAYASGNRAHMGIEADRAYGELATFLLKLHGRGVYFRDLSGGNILVQPQDDGRLEFMLIDTARARFFDRALPIRLRLADLARACHKLHPEGREHFLRLYLAPLGKRPGRLVRLPLQLYDLKMTIKRRLRKTRFHALLKR